MHRRRRGTGLRSGDGRRCRGRTGGHVVVDVIPRLHIEALHDAGRVFGLDGVGLGDIAELREVDRDADALLATCDLAVLIVEQSRAR